MSRIIINNDSELDDLTVLAFVSRVVAKGKISEAVGKPHYCWLTMFDLSTGKRLVISVRPKYAIYSESFRVWEQTKEQSPTES